MQNPSEFAILYVDDEPISLKYFREMFEDVAPILTAECPLEALEIFRDQSDQIGLVLSDFKMPKMKGIDFLEEVKKINPSPLRILITAYADLNMAVDLLNSNRLYGYLSKPWDAEELEGRLINALDYFALSQQRDQLLKEKSMAYNQLAIADRANTMNMVSVGFNHHLRNSLNVISSFFELAPYKLKEEFGVSTSDSPFWGEFHGEIREEIDRMIKLLTNFTHTSSTNQIQIEPDIDLHHIFSEAAEMLDSKGKPIELIINQDDGVPLVSGDLVKLQQMSRQLFSEAVANMPNGGQIEVRFTPAKSIGGVRVYFYDNGKVLGEKDLARVFEPFFARSDNPDELGFNLVGSYMTVYYHGGSMEAKRADDGRNLIEFILPTVPNPPEESISLSRQALQFPSDLDSVALSN